MSTKSASKLSRRRNTGMPELPSKGGQPNRKVMANLRSRQADWLKTVDSLKNDTGGYHKPGSMQR